MSDGKPGRPETPVHEKARQFRLGPVKDAQELARKLLNATLSGDITREQSMWEEFLNCPDKRVSFEAFRLLTSYAYGKPIDRVEAKVDGPAFVAKMPDKHDPEEWAKRYAVAPAPFKDQKSQ